MANDKTNTMISELNKKILKINTKVENIEKSSKDDKEDIKKLRDEVSGVKSDISGKYETEQKSQGKKTTIAIWVSIFSLLLSIITGGVTMYYQHSQKVADEFQLDVQQLQGDFLYDISLEDGAKTEVNLMDYSGTDEQQFYKVNNPYSICLDLKYGAPKNGYILQVVSGEIILCYKIDFKNLVQNIKIITIDELSGSFNQSVMGISATGEDVLYNTTYVIFEGIDNTIRSNLIISKYKMNEDKTLDHIKEEDVIYSELDLVRVLEILESDNYKYSKDFQIDDEIFDSLNNNDEKIRSYCLLEYAEILRKVQDLKNKFW